MIEVRWHGRGGQGAVTSVEMLALAAIEEGKYAQGFPSFGPERRGAPVAAFNRVNDKQIKVRSGIYNPDVVVVLDESLIGLVNVIDGLKKEGMLVVNTARSIDDIKNALNYKGLTAVIDAKKIAREELGVTIANTTMLGAVTKVTGVVNIDSFKDPIEHRFGRMAMKNMTAMKRAFDEVQVSSSSQKRKKTK